MGFLFKFDNVREAITRIPGALVDNVHMKYVQDVIRHPTPSFFAKIGSLFLKEDASPKLQNRPLYLKEKDNEESTAEKDKIGPVVKKQYQLDEPVEGDCSPLEIPHDLPLEVKGQLSADCPQLLCWLVYHSSVADQEELAAMMYYIKCKEYFIGHIQCDPNVGSQMNIWMKSAGQETWNEEKAGVWTNSINSNNFSTVRSKTRPHKRPKRNSLQMSVHVATAIYSQQLIFVSSKTTKLDYWLKMIFQNSGSMRPVYE
ncbi:hypothetical protein EDD85DRAFT_792046 [Armillaria nabsnona]|nr:hypothetical protein EDD85DRAFT_792046 [Armillaria nabsnona]